MSLQKSAALIISLCLMSACTVPPPCEEHDKHIYSSKYWTTDQADRTVTFVIHPGGSIRTCGYNYDRDTHLLWEHGCNFDNSYAVMH